MAKKQPYIKFYTSDWLGDAALQSCSIAAQGMWIKMLCIMHEAEPIGYLKRGDLVMQTDELLRTLSLTKRKYEKLLQELEISGVFSRENGTNCVYSRRMVHDREISLMRQAVGKKGGNPDLVNQPRGRANPESRVQSPESGKEEGSGKKTLQKKAERWDEFWDAYPKKQAKGQAQKVYQRLIEKKGASEQAIIAGLKTSPQLQRQKQYIPLASTWLNGEGWNDEPQASQSELGLEPGVQAEIDQGEREAAETERLTQEALRTGKQKPR